VTDSSNDAPDTTKRSVRRNLIIIAVSLLAGWLLLRFLGRIQWSAVGDALGQLHWWQLAALVVLLLVRQTFNAMPLKRFVPGLTQRKAMKNDLGANLVGTIAPPPGDVVIRVAMFRSWGINPVDGMTGVTLNMIVFYGARFIAPVIGLFFLAFVGIEKRQWISGLVSALIAAVIIVALVLIVRSDRWAAILGRTAARVVSRMKAEVDPDHWAGAVVEFRGRVAKILNRNLVPALLAMVVAILVDGTILFLSLRFVGVTAADVSWPEIMAAFLLVYPLTILPLFGLGALDALVIASWTEIAGVEFESTLLAGTIVWRTVTLGGNLALGAIATALWKADIRKSTGSKAAGTVAR
jgi:hypothetical protein